MPRSRKGNDDKPKEPLTYEQKLEKEKDYFRLHHSFDHPPENPTITYKPGDEVIYGALAECVVVEMLDAKSMVYHIRYHDVGKSYGVLYDNGYAPRIVWWNDLTPKVMVEETNFAKPRIHAQYMNMGLDSLIMTVYHRGLHINPEYQRGYVWTLENKQRLIKSIFDRLDIGKFVFVETWRNGAQDNRLEVIDGKQRLNAITEFMEGRFEYEGKTYFQLSHKDRNAFGDLQVHVCTLDEEKVSRADILWLFLSINRGGVPQTEEHIALTRAMYEEELIHPTPGSYRRDSENEQWKRDVGF